jgi:N-dimethylarginine dimethylaminohydrolase
MTTLKRNARLLMCAPEHFGVSYAINPWMDPASWARDNRAHAAAAREWADLHRTLAGLGADIDLVPSVPGLPDLVFTANAAVVLDRQVLLARFRHPERQREQVHFEAAFRSLQARGVVDAVRKLPPDVVLEGAGDCVWDPARQMFWTGYGPRSDKDAARVVAETYGVEALPLELVNPSFYHMDTALAPLPRGEVMYVPSAFSEEGLRQFHERVAPEQRIPLSAKDAGVFAANAVKLGDNIVMSSCSAALRRRLDEAGYQVHPTNLGTYHRSGGSAFCLTLRLDQRTEAGTASLRRVS